MTTIYVGSLPLSWGEEELRTLFAPFGEVASVTIITDGQTGCSRGFGFAEMEPGAAAAAIDALDGEEYEECFLRVNEARDRGARPPRREY
ncbi:MAG: RNA-binding protein [Gemmatimonadales bacterium]|nr:RNA-binding protein [Gemmatimonadales bacterium]